MNLVKTRGDAATLAIATSLLLSAVAYFFLPVTATPETVVADYLWALQEGDSAAALDAAQADVDTAADGADTTFLTDAALGDGWDVASVSTVGESGDSSEVVALLRDTGGEAAMRTFTVNHTIGGYVIDNPFVIVGVKMDAGYLDVNSVAEETGSRTYAFFPGGYSLYSSPKALLKSRPGRVVMAGGATLAPKVDFTAAGEKAAQAAIDDHIDGCAEAAQASLSDCPFSAADIRTDGHDYQFRETKWKVEEYPDIEITGATVGAVNDPVVRLIGRTYDGEDISLDCGMSVARYRLSVTPGTVKAEWDSNTPPDPVSCRPAD